MSTMSTTIAVPCLPCLPHVYYVRHVYTSSLPPCLIIHFLGYYQLGPTSVEAVRRGEVGLGYDTAFVFTEVNADVMTFVRDRDSPWGFTRTDTNTTQ